MYRRFEIGLAFVLVVAAGFAIGSWHEPGCGVLMLYFGFRRGLFGAP